MCLAIIASRVLSDWPLIVVANRDEFHQRPTAPMRPWSETASILAGRDLQAGGTWLGVTTSGRFALLTNYRDSKQLKKEAPSRGEWVAQFLKSSTAAAAYLEQASTVAQLYNGFNLVVDDGQIDQSIYCASNQSETFVTDITPGVHGLSNALLNAPWPKTQKTTNEMAALLASGETPDAEKLIQVLLDQTPVPDNDLPQTGLTLERERLLATPFIVSPTYGTRCTTLLMRHRDGRQWVREDTYNSVGDRTSTVRWFCHLGHDWRRLLD